MNGIQEGQTHSIRSAQREGLQVSGVKDVISFDERGVMMETTMGSMAVEGEDLHITVLNLSEGKVEIEGRLNAVYYIDEKPVVKRGLFGRRND